jgi:hypothetical protein
MATVKMATVRMAAVWRWILAVTLAFAILSPATHIATASQTSPKRIQCEGANTKTNSTPNTSQAGPSCCGEVSPRQQIPKLERNSLHNAGGRKKTKQRNTRRKSGKYKHKPCQSQKRQKIKVLSDEQTAAGTHNKKAAEHIAQFIEFREKLYSSFTYRADALMDLLDALCGNTRATSVVQLSLSPVFGREYASVHDAVDNFFAASCTEKTKQERDAHQQKIMRIVGSTCSKPVNRKFYVLGLDATPQPRQFAKTLQDRSFAYQPNPIVGNKPITIGHSYSVLVAMPEKDKTNAPPWVIPLSSCRVPTENKATETGAAQVKALQEDTELPIGKELSILVADAAYSAATFLCAVSEHKNQITIARVRGNRTFYRMPDQNPDQNNVLNGKGHPTWYGTSFKCKDPSTWGVPYETASTIYTTKKGRVCHVEIQAWQNMLMTGKKHIPMHKHPFTLLRTTVKDENGKAVYKKPLWTIAFGQRRHEISLLDAWESYRQRYDIEHFFRFGKNRLLMDSYQTPIVEHEENWWELSGLAYVQLWVAATLSQISPRPWERYLPNLKEKKDGLPTPSMVQRDMERIIGQFGSPSASPKPRGKSPGRQKGYSPGLRERYPVIKKSRPKDKKLAQAS